MTLAPLIATFADERALNRGRGDGGFLRSNRGVKVPVRTRYATGGSRFDLELAVDQAGRLFSCVDGRRADSRGMYPGLRRWDRERPIHRGLYAMDRQGDLFFGDPNTHSPDAQRWIDRRPGAPLPDAIVLWHHSSFVAGDAVICAGDLLIRDGLLLAASSWSGHYRPGPGHLAAMLGVLRDRGADLSSTVAEAVVDGRVRAFPALEFAAADGDVARVPEVTAAWRRDCAVAAAEEVTGRAFTAEDLGRLDERIAALGAFDDRAAFDPDAQVHWNWIARWILEEAYGEVP